MKAIMKRIVIMCNMKNNSNENNEIIVIMVMKAA